MNATLRLSLALAGAGAGTALSAWALARLLRQRRKSPDEIERQRRLGVNRRGRITLGNIVDIVDSEACSAPRRLIVYGYEVAGVSYEVAQDVSTLPGLSSHAHGLVGQPASIKYDPEQPTNSIIACEDWCGVALKEDNRESGIEAREKAELIPPPAPRT